MTVCKILGTLSLSLSLSLCASVAGPPTLPPLSLSLSLSLCARSMGQDDQLQCRTAGCPPDIDSGSWPKAMEFFHLTAVSFGLLAAIKLKVFDILAKHPNQQLSAAQILSHIYSPADESSTACSTDQSYQLRRATSIDSLNRLLRLLASHSLLTSSLSLDDPPTALYGLTPSSACFLQENNTASIAPHYLISRHEAYTQAWIHIPEAILEGASPFAKAHGTDLFSYGHNDPQFGQLFNSAMSTSSSMVMETLLRVYHGFDGLTSIVDVGGGSGACLHSIVLKYPQIDAINFDQPHVIQAAPAYSGVRHMEGNMFESIPQAQAIFLKWILHDWSDEACIKILKNCYHALPTMGKVIVLDIVLPSNVNTHIDNQYGYGWDLLMLTVTPGGRERTMQELEHIARLAGPFKVQVICKVNELSVVEMYKA